MKALTEASQELLWTSKATLRRDSELRVHDDVFASLEWQSAFRAAAIGRATDGAWSFRLEGFVLRQWVNVERIDDGSVVGVFDAQPSFNGSIEIGTTERYVWESNFWLTKWIWSNANGEEIVRVTRNLSIRPEGTVEITPDAAACPHISMLVLLGWYLIALMTDVRPG